MELSFSLKIIINHQIAVNVTSFIRKKTAFSAIHFEVRSGGLKPALAQSQISSKKTVKWIHISTDLIQYQNRIVWVTGWKSKINKQIQITVSLPYTYMYIVCVCAWTYICQSWHFPAIFFLLSSLSLFLPLRLSMEFSLSFSFVVYCNNSQPTIKIHLHTMRPTMPILSVRNVLELCVLLLFSIIFLLFPTYAPIELGPSFAEKYFHNPNNITI